MTWTDGYREWAPPAVLDTAVSCLWSRVVPAAGAPPTLVLPDACSDLIWRHGGEPFIAGPDTGPAPAPLRPGTVLVGARFRPGAGGPALCAALGSDLSHIRGQRIELADAAPDIAVRLPGSLTPADAVKYLTEVATYLVRSGPPDLVVRETARRLACPGARVNNLAAELGLSERQLRRRCQAAAGYGPKTLQRVLRFRRFVGRLDAGAGDLSLIAHDLGYADQAHLTRECSELAGLPPAALARVRHEAAPPANTPSRPQPARQRGDHGGSTRRETQRDHAPTRVQGVT